MRMLKRAIVLLVILLAMTPARAAGVGMKPTPVQSEFADQIYGLSQIGFNGALASPAFDSDPFEQPAQGKKRVSVVRAAVLSALLPGLGEYYVGNRAKAKYFFAGEALTWVGFFAFRTYGAWKKDDMIGFASQKANASLEDKDDDFLDWVGFYTSIYVFNTLGRVSDQDRLYLEDTPENHWLWQSEEDQEAYRSLKNSSREAYRRSNFMIGVAVIHRIISVIDAIRDAKRAGRGLDDEFGFSRESRYRLDINPLDRDRQVTFTIFAPF